MNQNTTTATVIALATFNALVGDLRTTHGLVLAGLKEVGQKPTFPEDFAKCGAEDYKNIHQAQRVLINAYRKAEWEKEVAGIRTGLKAVIATHMVTKQGEKAEYDATPAQFKKFLAPFPTAFAIPLTACASAFPKGTTPEQMVARCKELGYTVAKIGESFALKVAFEEAKVVKEETKEEEVAEVVELAKSA